MDDHVDEHASVAMTESVDAQLRDHLVRDDGQEDLCFALYRPSRGAHRFTALVVEPVFPEPGERGVFGAAEFMPEYLERVLEQALQRDMGVAFLHSHPRAHGWQNLSGPDHEAEHDMAGAVQSMTDLPLVGLTVSGQTGFWSARHWHRVGRRRWSPLHCENVRVVGRALNPSFCPGVKPALEPSGALTRTVHAWGDALQQQLARLRVGVVGLGSVGSLVTEQLARMGLGEVVCIDFDRVEEVNLDRTLHAYFEHVRIGESKARLAARAAQRSATNPGFQAHALDMGIQELPAYRRALDCDVLFSCVDRPWPRDILNFLSYAHLIPVIDGGIHVGKKPDGTLRSATWAAFVVGPERRCLECAGQYSSGLVDLERSGRLDDPDYIQGLPEGSPLRKRENVFAFSMSLASLEALKLVQLVGQPSGVSAPDEERYVYPANLSELDDETACVEHCSFRQIVGDGDDAGHPGTRTWP